MCEMCSGLLLMLLLLCTGLTVPVSSSTWQERLFGSDARGTSNKGHSPWRDQPASGQSASQCSITQTHIGSIPVGGTKVDHFDGYLDGGSIKECAAECCKLGAETCQYAWMFKDKCFMIGCKPENAWKCAPQLVSKLSSESIYTSVGHAGSKNLLAVSSTTASPVLPEEKTTATQVPSTATPPHTPPAAPSTTTASSVVATSTTASPALPQTNKDLTLSFAGETDLTLPTSSTRVFASTWPPPEQGEEFLYKWEKVSGPSEGALEGIDKDQLSLSGLVTGTYVLQLTVESKIGAQQGVGTVNVTVHPPVRANTPPVPVIKPSNHASVTLPLNSALFDASSSEDDLGSDTLSFHWEEVEGPVDSQLTSDTALLQLTDLKQGNYKYKLTVTDQDGLSADTFATVTVNPEPYYPPVAQAGKDQLLKLPNSEVVLDGSGSKAFKGELQFSWEKLVGPGPVDMKGTDTSHLHLHVSSTGDYLFRLTVTDTQGLSSSANVSVVVIPEHNLPPHADAGLDQTVVFPSTTATLNASASTDDYRIDAWEWSQLSGPEDITLSGSKSSVLKIKRLHIDEHEGSPTHYQFQLTVWDYHNLTDTANVTITFKKDPQVPPKVLAGGDVNITLPQNAVILNGSGSYDDFGIVSYKWVRSESSPAAGLVLNGSESKAMLMLSDLVEGTYKYTLTIVNTQHVSASDGVTIQVFPDPLDDYLIQVHLEGEISAFSVTKQQQLTRVLTLILADYDVDYDITIVQVLPFGPHILVEFSAVRADDHSYMNATQAYYKLTDKGQDYYYPHSNFHFLRINMKVCRLPCSGHGSCDRKTHKCSCSRYWMENPFKAHFGRSETNCDWSIFYVALAILVTTAVLLFLLWLSCCCCMRKRQRARTKRRVRYAMLERKNGDEQHLLKDEAHYQQTSLMVSGSETEEEILFESAKKDAEKATVSIRSSKPLTARVSPTGQREET